MPKGVYNHKPASEEAKRHMREARKGEKNSGQFIKGNKGYWLGKKRSKELIEKLRKANLGRKMIKATKEKISENNARHWKGKKFSEKHRERIGLARRGKKMGKDNPAWKGGITPENHLIRTSVEFRLWREAVFARDGWTCQKCGDNSGGNLHPHHILNFAEYPELRFAIDNGITFCENDHIKFHKKYGYKNNTKEQLIEFLKVKEGNKK